MGRDIFIFAPATWVMKQVLTLLARAATCCGWCRGPRLLAIATLLALAARAEARSAVALPELAPPDANARVLVVAPHPDDETLCCAGYLQRAVLAGAAVAVVWVTAGDSFEIDAMIAERTLRPKGRGLEQLGARRIAEAQAAADLLGVPRSHQFILGYPDRGLGALLADDGSSVHRSVYTGDDAVPYAQALSAGKPYTGNNLRSDLAAVIARFAPTVVLVPAPQDRHIDHRASGLLACELLASAAPQAHIYYWIVHAGLRWPWPHGLHRKRPLLPPARAQALSWQGLPLDDTAQLGKLQALRQHRTQREVMGWFLNSFVRSNELFAPAP
jgi:LmbE family N-acetylglucosaminyl deacetylase